MNILNNKELLNISGGSFIKKIIELVGFVKYCIWEYFDYKKR